MVKVGDTVTRQEYGMTVTGVVGHISPAPTRAERWDYLYTAESGYLGRSDTVTVVKRAPEPEPTGLGAVVRDKDGTLWVRTDTDPHDDLSWWSVVAPWAKGSELVTPWGRWSDMDEPTVLSPGWTEED